MPERSNQEISRILSESAKLLDIQGENPFRIRAYRKAALVIANLPQPLSRILAHGGPKALEALPGVGENIAKKIVEILETGQLAQYQRLQEQIPPELAHLADIRGLGATRLRILHEKLKVSKLEDLKRAALAGEIRRLEGFGAKSEQNILKGIADFEKHRGRFKLATIYPYAQAVIAFLSSIPGVRRVQAAGSLRRGKETVGDLDILVSAGLGSAVLDEFLKYDAIKEILAHGPTKLSLLLEVGIQLDLRLLPADSFGAGLHYFTGSQQHNIAMRRRAQERGLKLNEYGLFKGGEKIAGEKEEDIFQELGLSYIPPELREGGEEIGAAESGNLPRLLLQSQLKGDLHVHSDYSDGYHNLEEIARAARQMDYQYLAITDHSRGQRQAHGLDEKRLLQQMEQIDRLNTRFSDFKLLKGIEVDILKNGELDLPRLLLKKLDLVIASIHSHFNQPKQQATARLIEAMRSNVVHIIGHPSARLIQEREPLELDMPELFRAARRHGVAMELNASGSRLDLNDANCRLAKQMGVKIAISTDSHSTLQLPGIRYGVFTARRGWLEAAQVINTLPYRQLSEFLRRK